MPALMRLNRVFVSLEVYTGHTKHTYCICNPVSHFAAFVNRIPSTPRFPAARRHTAPTNAFKFDCSSAGGMLRCSRCARVPARSVHSLSAAAQAHHPSCCCNLVSHPYCHPRSGSAARPLSDGPSRQLLNWGGGLSCRGFPDIRFGDSYQALALPQHKLVIGRVQLFNHGKHPFGLKSTGYKLSGRRGPLQGTLRCPRSTIDPGSMLQVWHEGGGGGETAR